MDSLRDPAEFVARAARTGQRVVMGHHFDRDESAGPSQYRCRNCGGRITLPVAYLGDRTYDCDYSGGPDVCEKRAGVGA